MTVGSNRASEHSLRAFFTRSSQSFRVRHSPASCGLNASAHQNQRGLYREFQGLRPLARRMPHARFTGRPVRSKSLYEEKPSNRVRAHQGMPFGLTPVRAFASAESSTLLGMSPSLDLPLHGLKVSLHAIHADRDRLDERERLRMLGKAWSEHTWDNVSELMDRRRDIV